MNAKQLEKWIMRENHDSCSMYPSVNPDVAEIQIGLPARKHKQIVDKELGDAL